MIYFIAEAIGLLGVAIVRLFPFDDVKIALANGVFSATTAIGYSISRSLWSYLIFLTVCFLSALAYAFWRKSDKTEIKISSEPRKMTISNVEIFLVLSTIVVLGSLSIIFRERAFSFNSLNSEEFYNLTAAAELHTGNFDIIYPYSIGNLFIINLLDSATGILAYKIFLNILAIVAIYWMICWFVSEKKMRLLIFFWLIIFNLQSLVSPTFHRNVLRFISPAIIVVAIHYLLSRQMKFYNLLFAVSVLIFSILFFFSADTLVISLLSYLIFIGTLLARRIPVRDLLPWLAGPVAGVVAVVLIFGFNYFSLIRSQISSIIVYSGFANTTPYFDFYDIFHPSISMAYLKLLVYLPIFYLPIVILGAIIIFIVINFRHFGLRNNFFSALILLTLSFILYYRQNFGDAGAGRISITSLVLVFMVLALTNLRSLAGKRIVQVSLIFFTIFTVINIYFLKQNVVYYLDFYRKQVAHTDMIDCSSAIFGHQLNRAGFDWCDRDVTAMLVRLAEKIGEDYFYVYDDTFSLYYILKSRPIVLIPTYYMAYNRQRVIVEKIETIGSRFMIYPSKMNFFGVAETERNNSNFMKLINSYRDEKFRLFDSSPDYLLYKRI